MRRLLNHYTLSNATQYHDLIVLLGQPVLPPSADAGPSEQATPEHADAAPEPAQVPLYGLSHEPIEPQIGRS